MLKQRRGIFVCIEGLDGSGKTTHAHRLVRNLRRKRFDTIYTAEPSRGKIGRFIRSHILQRKKRVPRVVEALLFATDRVDHVENTIVPALERKKIVVSDRYFYSSLAYQGATGLDLKWIEEINRFALQPDLAIYLDVPPEVVVKRMQRKKSVMENVETQRRVEKVYLKFVENGMLVPVDGNRKKNEVTKKISTVVLDFLKKRELYRKTTS